MKTWFIGVMLLSVAVISGCQSPSGRVTKLAQGKDTLEEAVSDLLEQAKALTPTQIKGTCRLDYLDEDGTWRESSAFRMKLWLDPPYNLYVQIAVTMGPNGKIFLGTNQEAFWLSIKPEINTYWHGRWNDMPAVTDMKLNPGIVLESLGVIQFAQDETWTLANHEGMDVLTCTESSSEQVTKRIVVNTKKYQPSKILYYDDLGNVAVSADMGRYKVVGGQILPTLIYITQYSVDQEIGRATFHFEEGRGRRSEELHRHAMFQLNVPTTGYDEIIDVSSSGSMQE